MSRPKKNLSIVTCIKVPYRDEFKYLEVNQPTQNMLNVLSEGNLSYHDTMGTFQVSYKESRRNVTSDLLDEIRG